MSKPGCWHGDRWEMNGNKTERNKKKDEKNRTMKQGLKIVKERF